ncbi:Rnase H [Vibrio phage River4]|uniref:ribonuclease H n=1 Tax=Vibrio phage River4 TaxID=2736288 RepID=A0A6M9Z043_9CAUD|nr:Rnase H [Vibrio phage River4]QKN84746.1 ribonuclease H [Vibrio phage River4]
MFRVFTDGGCRGNPGIGAWGMVVYLGTEHKGTKSGFCEVTTNNAMELTAIDEALKWAVRANQKELEILTDSNYALQGIKSWMHSWVKNNWIKSDKKPVLNLELWKSIYKNSQKINLTMTKVKAHSGIEGNEQADALCNVLMDEWELENVVMK